MKVASLVYLSLLCTKVQNYLLNQTEEGEKRPGVRAGVGSLYDVSVELHIF